MQPKMARLVFPPPHRRRFANSHRRAGPTNGPLLRGCCFGLLLLDFLQTVLENQTSRRVSRHRFRFENFYDLICTQLAKNGRLN
jgi:hypothetical protein